MCDNMVSVEEVKENFPFEPYKINKVLVTPEKYEVIKKKKAKEYSTYTKEYKIMLLKKFFANMENGNSEERSFIYHRLYNNIDKVFFVTERSWFMNPLIYDPKIDSLEFKTSCSFLFNCWENNVWGEKRTLREKINFMIDTCGGIVLCISSPDIAETLCIKKLAKRWILSGEDILKWGELHNIKEYIVYIEEKNKYIKVDDKIENLKLYKLLSCRCLDSKAWVGIIEYTGRIY